MVYVVKDGSVVDRRPWDLSRIAEVFSGFWFVIVHFFLTLVAPFRQENRNSRTPYNQHDGGWGPGGGGGGGVAGRGSGSGNFSGRNNLNANFRSNRRIGRIMNTSMDCNIPGGG